MLGLQKDTYYATLIRVLMQDIRLKRPSILKSIDSSSIKENPRLSQIEKIKLSVIIDIDLSDQQIMQNATEVLFDLYHGNHPLYTQFMNH